MLNCTYIKFQTKSETLSSTGYSTFTEKISVIGQTPFNVTMTSIANGGANLNFNNFNINADYQQVLDESAGTFAISAGMNF